MICVSAIGALGASAMDISGAADLGRGAVAGAFVIGAAYLAGLAVFRRSAAAVCALLMVSAAAALEFSWLGLLTIPSPQIFVLLQGLFAASAIIFVSSVIRAARNNALLGGIMFAAALSLVGLGAINLVARGEAGGLMRAALIGVGAFAAFLALVQARRDLGARLILPGALLALAAPAAAHFMGGGAALVPHAFFTLGILGASLVALVDTAPPRIADLGLHHGDLSLNQGETPAPAEAERDHAAPAHEEAMRLSENQLAQVLDYAGVAVWDWCPHGAHQTEGLPALVGAEARSVLSPETMRNFVHKDDAEAFDRRVLGQGEGGDAAFDAVLKLKDGRHIRFRGARAVDADGAIERLVAFVEAAPEARKAPKTAPGAAAASLGKAAPAAAQPNPLEAAIAGALEKGEITAAFQPIVSLDGGRIVGYEALARWPGDKGGAHRASAIELVHAAEAAGQGAVLAQRILAAAAKHLADEMKAQNRRDLFVAMNLSFAQMREAGFAAALEKAMAEHALPARSIVLELTESQEISDDAAARETFSRLKKAGAALAFDDFGSGFSSLRNLQKFSFDYLKIDKSFIDGLARGGAETKIARAIAGLGRDLGLTVIAEGIESETTAKAALDIGCSLGQGFALGEPGASQAAEPAESVQAPAEPGLEIAAAGGAAAAEPPAFDKKRWLMR